MGALTIFLTFIEGKGKKVSNFKISHFFFSPITTLFCSLGRFLYCPVHFARYILYRAKFVPGNVLGKKFLYAPGTKCSGKLKLILYSFPVQDQVKFLVHFPLNLSSIVEKSNSMEAAEKKDLEALVEAGVKAVVE